MAKEKNWTASMIETLVDDAISEKEERGVTVESVEPYDGYFTVNLKGDISLPAINAIARNVGSKYITIGAEEYNALTLFFKPGVSEDYEFDDDNPEPEEEDCTPHIPDNMRHTDRFPDAEDLIIPGTERRVSNTEMCEQIIKWIGETRHIPIVYLRLDDGVHVEVSEAYDRRIKAVIQEGSAIGADARRYTFANGGDLYPISSDICIRATCDETGRSDMYGLTFFV